MTFVVGHDSGENSLPPPAVRGSGMNLERSSTVVVGTRKGIRITIVDSFISTIVLQAMHSPSPNRSIVVLFATFCYEAVVST